MSTDSKMKFRKLQIKLAYNDKEADDFLFMCRRIQREFSQTTCFVSDPANRIVTDVFQCRLYELDIARPERQRRLKLTIPLYQKPSHSEELLLIALVPERDNRVEVPVHREHQRKYVST
jgi:hypothetical protein